MNDERARVVHILAQVMAAGASFSGGSRYSGGSPFEGVHTATEVAEVGVWKLVALRILVAVALRGSIAVSGGERHVGCLGEASLGHEEPESLGSPTQGTGEAGVQ